MRSNYRDVDDNFKSGDAVTVKHGYYPLELGKKLSPRFSGPHLIIEVKPNSGFKVVNCENGKEMVQNISKLKQFFKKEPENVLKFRKKYKLFPRNTGASGNASSSKALFRN